MKQCKDFIRPFFRMAKNKGLPRDILNLVSEIVDHCRARCGDRADLTAAVVQPRTLRCMNSEHPRCSDCNTFTPTPSSECPSRRRNYHMAGDAYIRLAIGNAAWPIGVSAVGLHERAAREKVGEGVQAHVMNDEAQRKYITTIKRLVTYAQSRYPSDPSRSIYS